MLIRALESGARVGMGMRMHHSQLQALLEEMAWQPGVLWFAVTDESGKIIAHSDPRRVGESLYPASTLRELNIGSEALAPARKTGTGAGDLSSISPA